MLYIVLCIVAWGCWGIVQKLAIRHASPFMVQIISSYVYSIVGPVIFLYMKATKQEMVWNPSGIAWTTLSCVLAVAGGLSFSAAIQRAPVNSVVGLTSAYPVLTFLLAAVLLGEPVTLRRVIGIVVVAAGLIIVNG